MGAAVIVCSGRIDDHSCYGKYFAQAEYIICADGGAAHMRKFGFVPDVLLGDFDSVNKTDLEFYSENHPDKTKIIKYPARKDQTDSEIAVLLAAEKGYNPIYLLGAYGSRADHSLANIFLLARMLESGVQCIIADEHNEVYAVKDKITLTRDKACRDKARNETTIKARNETRNETRNEACRVSIIPLGNEITGVTTKGLYYELSGAAIKAGSTLGISNEFAADSAEITIGCGTAIVIKAWD